MSSKGRGQKLDPSGSDDYPTPAWCVHRLLEWWTPRMGVWVEPAAGNGSLIRTVDSCLSRVYTPEWWVYEVNPNKRVELLDTKSVTRLKTASFLEQCVVEEEVTAVITNPPYTYAAEFILKARELYPHAEVVMLLRVGLMESDGRADFWRQVGIPDLGILPNRASFINAASGALKTDSTVYAWFVWPPATQEPREAGKVVLLKHTSLEDRKTWR